MQHFILSEWLNTFVIVTVCVQSVILLYESSHRHPTWMQGSGVLLRYKMMHPN